MLILLPERKSLSTRDQNCLSCFAKYCLAVSSRYTYCEFNKNILIIQMKILFLPYPQTIYYSNSEITQLFYKVHSRWTIHCDGCFQE